MIRKYKILGYAFAIFICGIIAFEIVGSNTKNVSTAGTVTEDFSALSNKKICWGIKRADNHKQPDVGAENKSLMEKCGSYYMGNANNKYVYLTFDAGYEARIYRKNFRSSKGKQCYSNFFYNRALPK